MAGVSIPHELTKKRLSIAFKSRLMSEFYWDFSAGFRWVCSEPSNGLLTGVFWWPRHNAKSWKYGPHTLETDHIGHFEVPVPFRTQFHRLTTDLFEKWFWWWFTTIQNVINKQKFNTNPLHRSGVIAGESSADMMPVAKTVAIESVFIFHHRSGDGMICVRFCWWFTRNSDSVIQRKLQKDFIKISIAKPSMFFANWIGSCLNVWLWYFPSEPTGMTVTCSIPPSSCFGALALSVRVFAGCILFQKSCLYEALINSIELHRLLSPIVVA